MPLAAHKYAPGVRLLCFEPDPSKAKLIYHVEVSSLCGFTFRGRSKVPQYFVHFLGWKRKWDREVCEDLLLENSEFNKTLKIKIDEIAAHVKDKVKRTERIDLILLKAATAQEDIDWDNLPGVWKGVSHTSYDRNFKIVDKVHLTTKNEPQSPQSFSDYSEEAEDMDSDELAHANFEAIDDHEKFSPDVQLPQSLFIILETHCRPFEDPTYVQLKRLHKSPSWCCVLDLLESYVRGFPYNLSIMNSTMIIKDNSAQFSSTSQRERFSRMAAAEYLKIDRSRHLCAEFCSSVQILFDALLVEYLLYPSEEKQHIPLIRNGKKRSSTQTTSNSASKEAQFTLLPKEEIESSPTLPCLTYEAVYLLRLLVRLPALVNQMALSKCRRSIVLRHLALFISYLESSREFWFTDVRPNTPNPLISQPQQINNQHRVRLSSRTVSVSSSVNLTVSPASNRPPRLSSTVRQSIQPSKVKPRSSRQSSSTRSQRSSAMIDIKEKPNQSIPAKSIRSSCSESSSTLTVPQQMPHRSLRSSGPTTTDQLADQPKKRLFKREEESKPPNKQPRILQAPAVPTPLPLTLPQKLKIKNDNTRGTRLSLPAPVKRKSIPTTSTSLISAASKRVLGVRKTLPIANRTRLRSICSP